jgi:hypothetical protein
LIIKPTILFGGSNDQFSWLLIFPLIAALTNAVSFMYLHELKNKISNMIALHYFYIFQTFLSGVLQNFSPSTKTLDTLSPIYYLLFIGLVLSAYLTQNLISKSIYLKKPSYIMPFGYIGIIGSFISDIFLFETHLDTLSIIGMILASFCLFFKLFIE